MNPWWAFKINENKSHSFIFDNAIKERSQDLEDLFCPTGSIWMAKVRALKKTRSFYNRNQQFFEIDWISAVDIDDENDLSFAKSLQHLK
jgi:N-acylneuraminate cytidylyltransferase